MGSAKKTWARIHQRPLRSDITIYEIHGLLLALGYERLRISGSHRHYKHPLMNELLTLPGHSDHDVLKPGYLLIILRQIETTQLELKQKGKVK